MSAVPWAVVATTAGGVATTLLGVVAGGLLGRRTQDRHWLKDTKSAAYAAVLREYMRVEFDLRRAHLGRRPPQVDWAQWGAALATLSLVAEDRVVLAAQAITETLNGMEAYIHAGDRDEDAWARLLNTLADAQMEFVNTARQSLDKTQSALSTRIGGPLTQHDDR
ncbi:MAG TPA: hypothetical protein VFU43_08225 [Streptosporangiaceae bacterium]|nr:hypothetical protein [Streptosporangiaceae bacterium]